MNINVSLEFHLGLDMNLKHVIDDKEVLTWSSYSQFFLVITRKPHLIGHSHIYIYIWQNLFGSVN